jgi:membrane protein implicated in regulation of membrane protease activity
MTPQKQNKEMTKSFYVLLMLIPVFMFGVLGAGLGLIGDNSNPLSGFLWGVGIGVALCVAMVIGMFGWEWIKKEADKGKLYPYILIGFLVAIAISGFLAINLGNPS